VMIACIAKQTPPRRYSRARAKPYGLRVKQFTFDVRATRDATGMKIASGHYHR
jgi:hypothetical protein